jgi:hypothetical protein
MSVLFGNVFPVVALIASKMLAFRFTSDDMPDDLL